MSRGASAYEVVVLGGGPAGLAAAISIRTTTQASVLVVEAQGPDHERVGESCPPDLVLLLKRLGVARAFYRDGHETCPGYASVWGRADVGYNDAIVNPLGPSWRLDRRRFDAMLAARASELGAQVVGSTRFVAAQPDPAGGYRLEFERGGPVHAGFVVDATGSMARFARGLGVHKEVRDQLYATLRFARVEQATGSRRVLLEALPTGWCYQALLPANRVVSMIVSEKAPVAELRADDFERFEAMLGGTSLVGPSLARLRLSQPSYHTVCIRSGCLPTVEGDDWMAVGDAAASFDPIAAQGIIKGLGHGLRAGPKVQAWLAGEGASQRAHSAAVGQQYRDYERARTHLYGLEGRWPAAAFWRGRQGISDAYASSAR